VALAGGFRQGATLLSQAQRLAEGSLAPSSRRQYARLWEEFDRRRQDAAAPPSEEQLIKHIAWLHVMKRGQQSKAFLSAARAICILKHLDTSGFTVYAARVAEGATRAAAKYRKVRIPTDPFPVAALRLFVEKLGATPSLRHLRDAAIVALGFRSVRRASELTALRWSDVQFGDGQLIMSIRRSKRDQHGRGHTVRIEVENSPLCPVRLLARYRGALSEEQRGPDHFVFFAAGRGASLTVSAISSIVKKMTAAANCQGSFSSHSLRIGGASALARAGFSEGQIMAVGGWVSQSVRRYMRADATQRQGVSTRMGFR
jgi:integrase